MDSLFEVLADPQRRRILDLLAERPRSAGELGALLALSQPGTSRHLRQLREAGFVAVVPVAQQRIYSLAPEPFEELSGWLDRYRRALGRQLDSLGAYLDAHPTRGDAPGPSPEPWPVAPEPHPLKFPRSTDE